MKQSEGRVPGRRGGGPPPSFGRPNDEPEDFTVKGGAAIHLVVHAEVTPDPESLARLHEAIRTTTASAVLAGYADAFDQMETMDQAPDGGATDGPGDDDGGPSPGRPRTIGERPGDWTP